NVRFSAVGRGSAALALAIGLSGGVCSSVTTQRRSRFAFSPFARATAAIDTPGCRQADTTFALNSALCVRRRRRTIPRSEVSMCPPKTQVDTIILSQTWPSKMTLPAAYPAKPGGVTYVPGIKCYPSLRKDKILSRQSQVTLELSNAGL